MAEFVVGYPGAILLAINVEEDFNKRDRRGAILERDWTKGSIIGNILSLSWPMVVSGILNTLGPTIDMIWVGRLGTVAMAGVGVSGMIVMLVNSMMMGFNTGVRALVARFIGAGDTEMANLTGQQTLIIKSIISLFLALVGIFFAEPILILFGLEPEVITEGTVYLRILFVGSVTIAFNSMAEATMQASGDAVTPMRIAVAYRLLHIVLSPVLIFGWWVFPHLGVSGAALANVFAQGVGGTLGLWFLFSGRTRLRLTMKNFRFDRSMAWRIIKVGIPASITGFERTFSNLVVMWFVVPFGTIAVAAHSLLERTDQFLRMPSAGMGMAAGILAGQNLGAGQPERAERTGWQTAALVTVLMVAVSVPVWIGAERIVGIFNTEPELVKVASIFLRIEIVSYLVFGLVNTLMNCLNGVGDTMIPLLTTMLTMWGIQVPLAYFLSRMTSLGVYGVRVAIVSAIAMRAVIYSAYFRSGRWKRKNV
ncbi:MAG: MATE family efflux transporter [Chloroflexi bacterium]|nr:MATE family efflux transporter [Chloroflexota bacterium]